MATTNSRLPIRGTDHGPGLCSNCARHADTRYDYGTPRPYCRMSCAFTDPVTTAETATTPATPNVVRVAPSRQAAPSLFDAVA